MRRCRAQPAAVASCASGGYHHPLPEWARTGFSPGATGPPNTVGRDGRIAAVVFGWPLASPPAKDRGNKVLWVTRTVPNHAAPPLRIEAQRVAGDRLIGDPVRRVIESGPGPSYLDLPAKGCWRLQLRWGREHDTLELPYT